MINNSNEKGYKKLIVWKRSDELVYQIYLATVDFPNNETYGLVSQVRRAAVSIPANIAEAMGRQNRGETRQFINVALGSLAETEYLLELSLRLGYLSKENFTNLDPLRAETGRLLWRLYQSL